jgi:hypothetical protein
LPLALAFAVDREEVADLLAKVPVSIDRDVAGEMHGVVRSGNGQDELAAAVEFAYQGFGIEKPRVRQCLGWSVIRCHVRRFCGVLGRVSTRKIYICYRNYMASGVLWRFRVTRENMVVFVG